MIDDAVPRRRETRYRVRNSDTISAQLTWDGHPDESIRGTVIDISCGGFRICVPKCLPRGAQLAVRMRIEPTDEEYELTADMCWSALQKDGSWFLGCALRSPIAESKIAKLAALEVLDRRNESRFPLSVQATCRTEASVKEVPLRLLNFSPGGFGAAVAEPFLEIGNRVLIKLGGGGVLRGRVMWVNERGGEQIFGGTFVHRHDYETLISEVRPHARQSWLKALAKHRPTQWRPIAAAVALVMMVQLIHIVNNRPDLVRKFDQVVLQRIEPWWNAIKKSIDSSEQSAG